MNKIKSEKITSVEEVLNFSKQLPSFKGDFEFVYRGQVNAEWKIIPSIMRGSWDRDLAQKHETALFMPILRGPVPFLQTYDPIEYLTILQHYNIPTRLLDWTFNSLKALFFACYDPNNEYKNKDGRMFIINRIDFHPLEMSSSKLDNYYDWNIVKKGDYLKRLWGIDTVNYFEPINKNPRIIAQEGCFLCFSFLPINVGDEHFYCLDEYIGTRNNYMIASGNPLRYPSQSPKFPECDIFHISKLVDKEFKQSILDDLRVNYGISEDSLLLYHEPYNKAVEQFFSVALQQAKDKIQDYLMRRKLK